MKKELENWKNFLLQEDCWDGYERVPGTAEGAPGSCRKRTNEDTRDTYDSEVVDRNKKSRQKGIATLAKEEKEKPDLRSKVIKALRDEGGAAGMDALEKHTGASKSEISKVVDAAENIKVHKDGDYILMDSLNEEEELLDENGVPLQHIHEEGKICPKGKAWAMRKYGKWSAYAAMGASKYCKDPNYGKGKKKKKNESVELDEGELAKWRSENWVQSDGTPCGDAKAQKNPKRCKPASKWSGMSKSEKKADDAKKKAGGKKGKQFVSATKKGKVTKGHTKESMEMNTSQLKQIIREVLANHLEEGAKLGHSGDDMRGYKDWQEGMSKPAEPDNAEYMKGWEAAEQRFGMYREGVDVSYYHIVDATYDDGALAEDVEFWDDVLEEAEYQGRKVTLNKPMKGDVKKSKVYVKDPKTGNVKKVNFGDPNMKIKKSNPKRRKSFRARHNCDNPGPKTKARYWSCRAW